MKKIINDIKILHVEDSASDASLISRKVKRNENNFEILDIDTRDNYIKALKNYKPDIILFDHSLSAFSPKEGLHILNKSKVDVPFILLTENINIDFCTAMLKNGASDYILKNKPENLLLLIEKTIIKFKLEKEKLESCRTLDDGTRKFQALIEASSDVVNILTKEGEISYTSPSIEPLLGFSEKEANKRKLIELLNLDNPEIFSEALRNNVSDPEKKYNSVLILAKNRNGKSIWLQASFINHLDDASINGIVVCLKDVTKETLSEINISESEKKYRAFFENSLDGILLTTINGNIQAANPAACKMFQMTEAEICKKGRSGFVDLKDPRLNGALEERERTGKTKSEINMFRKDGSYFLAELTSAIIEPNNGYAYLIIKDNTEKKQLKHDLEMSEERYKSLFKFNPLPTFVFNENDLKIVDVNDSCSATYGFTREEFLKMTLRNLGNPKEIAQLNGTIEKFRNSDKSSFHSYSKHLKKDKSEILVENNSHRFYIDEIPYIVAVSNDITEKDKNLKKLTDITEKLKVAEKIAKIGYWELNLSEDSLFCSHYVYKIYGIEDKKIKPEKNVFLDMIHPVDKKKYSKEVENLLLGVKGNELEFRIVLKDGTVKWLYSRSKLVKLSNGQVHCVKGIIQDITSHKIAFEKLVRSESRYRGLIQSQTNYFVRIEMDGNYSFCNKKFIEEFGWAFPENNPIGQSSLIDVMAYHHQKLRETSEKCISTPNVNCQMEIDKRIKNGGIKTTLWDMIYLSSDGEIGEIQCVGIDISERVKVERENKFQANLLEKIGQGIIATDANDNVTYWNKAAEVMYQWKKEDVLGKNIFKLLFGDYEKHNEILQLLKSGKSWAGELIAIRKDQSTFPTQLTKSPLLDGHDNFLGVIRISSDISKLQKSEIKLKKLNKDLKDYTKELVAANKGLEQFSYIVSHNLRAPIANIIGIVDLLENNSQPKDIQNQLLNEIFVNVGRLDDVMRDLNENLKLKAEFIKEREYINLEVLVQNILTSNQNWIAKENVHIITDFRAIEEIYTVKSYLYSAFYNLISNSIKYRKPDVFPVIEITTEVNDNQVIIHFKDNGLGIDLEKKGDLIFGFYKRFHNHVEGKGLGLFMVKSQLEMLGGQIKVKSSVGVGTEFIIYLQNNI